ncbi:Oxygen-independent coproporphyrinogen-III oxidase-like protein sll1917 [Olea europaea subsp. europaea]|uniref:Oxygen-independent coproporphyrinogen-III oxidase-like protein sll1917 n=1 Tax=Olea europaea subsp. europaea TaxID=158383 RepID=A0A8S0UWD2_OLEEU|nr:Oxygen-independent coproporphyrinogen-III oxidase-like protein sll1917 [Olea europaea subsp. europaea]
MDKKGKATRVDTVIAGVVKETVVEKRVGVTTTTITEEQAGSSHSAPTFGLHVKRTPRPTRILRSPYVIDAGKQSKHSNGVIVFDKHVMQADEANLIAFQNWFNKGYKPRNKYISSSCLCARASYEFTDGFN